MVTRRQIYPVRSGYTEICHQISTRLERRGFSVSLASYGGRPILRTSSYRGGRPSFLQRLLYVMDWSNIRINTSFPFLKEILKTLLGEGVDLVQAEGFWVAPIAASAAKLAQLPVVIHDYNVPTYPTNLDRGLNMGMAAIWVKLGFLLADTITVTMDAEKSFLSSQGFPEDLIHVVPNGVDFQKFDLAEKEVEAMKDELGLKPDDKVVIFIGDFEWPPNREAARIVVERLAPKVSKEVLEVKFLLVGAPPLDYKHKSVIYTGRRDAAILRVADVGIAPLEFGGGTSIKVLEYMASRLPFVSTSFGVRGLTVRNGVEGFISDDYNTFADRIVELLRNEDVRQAMGRNGRRLVEQVYDWERIIGRLVNIYEALLT